MNHKDLTINHRLESWVYANAAARLAASGFVAGDVGRIAFQTDTGQYWRLTAVTPTWQLIAGNLVYAHLQTIQVNPAGTTSTTGVMTGLAGALTPAITGKVFVTISGSMGNTTNNDGVFTQIRYGTGSVPANGAALTGTVIGSTQGRYGGDWLDQEFTPFSVSAVISGLTPGTPIWIDLEQKAYVGGTAILAGVSVAAVELP